MKRRVRCSHGFFFGVATVLFRRTHGNARVPGSSIRLSVHKHSTSSRAQHVSTFRKRSYHGGSSESPRTRRNFTGSLGNHDAPDNKTCLGHEVYRRINCFSVAQIIAVARLCIALKNLGCKGYPERVTPRESTIHSAQHQGQHAKPPLLSSSHIQIQQKFHAALTRGEFRAVCSGATKKTSIHSLPPVANRAPASSRHGKGRILDTSSFGVMIVHRRSSGALE